MMSHVDTHQIYMMINTLQMNVYTVYEYTSPLPSISIQTENITTIHYPPQSASLRSTFGKQSQPSSTSQYDLSYNF